MDGWVWTDRYRQWPAMSKVERPLQCRRAWLRWRRADDTVDAALPAADLPHPVEHHESVVQPRLLLRVAALGPGVADSTAGPTKPAHTWRGTRAAGAAAVPAPGEKVRAAAEPSSLEREGECAWLPHV